MDSINTNGGNHPDGFGCMGMEPPEEKDFGPTEPYGGPGDVKLGPGDVKFGPGGQSGIEKAKFHIEK